MIQIRHLNADELHLARQIDVSEQGDIVYHYVDGRLESRADSWQRPVWSEEEWEAMIRQWTVQLRWDVMLGAFSEAKLVGLGSLRYRLEGTTAQLTTLHVSRPYRRQGVARRLVQEIIRLCKEKGARRLYVSATPSVSAVHFYQSQGFRLAEQVHAELFALEPEDIHMVKGL